MPVISLLLTLKWKGIARIMAAELGQRPPNLRVDDLLAAGEAALPGSPEQAHTYFRQAALTDPYDERVWLNLLRVVQSPADKRVCLQNVIAINPLNAEARRQLRTLDVQARAADAEQRLVERRKDKRGKVFRNAVLAGMGIGVLALVLAVFLSIVIFGAGVLPPPPWMP